MEKVSSERLNSVAVEVLRYLLLAEEAWWCHSRLIGNTGLVVHQLQLQVLDFLLQLQHLGLEGLAVLAANKSTQENMLVN